MPKLHRLACLVFALAVAPLPALAAPAVTAAAAAPGKAPVGGSYTADIGAFLESMRWYERGIKAAPRPADPIEREFMDAFLASMTPAQFHAKATPVFSRYINAKQAATLGAMARKKPVPLGQQQAALQAFWAMDKQAGPELGRVWGELSTDFGKRMEARAVTEIRRAVADLAAHRGTGYTLKMNKIGLPLLDRLAWLSVNNILHQMNASDAMDRSCQRAGIDTALQAPQLLAQNGIAAARQTLDACQQALEAMEKSNEQDFTQLHQDILALKLPDSAGMAAQLDKQARAFYDFSLKYGELSRQLLEAQRRLVSLVEARRATIQLEGDAMMFESNEDVVEANRAGDEIATLVKAVNDLVYQERQKSVLRGIDLHDNVTAPEKAAEGV
ncbi:MAG: hypothetical protein AB1807_09925 [Pseudomonadota bacterium]